MPIQKQYSIDDLAPVITSLLAEGKKVIVSAAGNSMYPLIRNQKDAIVLTAYKGESVSIGDMIFYKRTNGQYVLHRVVAIENGEFTLMGDNQTLQEKGITNQQIIALPIAVIRGKKTIDINSKGYLLYKKAWTKTNIFRKAGIGFFNLRIRASKRLKKIINK